MTASGAAVEQIRVLHGTATTSGHLVVCRHTPDGWLENIASAPPSEPDPILQVAHSNDVYITAALHRPGGGRTNDNVAELTNLWVELDRVTSSPNKDDQTTFHDLADVREFIDLLDMGEPALAVDSGNGWHLYWTLETPEVGQRTIAAALHRWRFLCTSTAAAMGKTIDNVFDPARLLRLAGTRNWYKNPHDPRPVVLVDDDQLPRGEPLTAAELGRIPTLAEAEKALGGVGATCTVFNVGNAEAAAKLRAWSKAKTSKAGQKIIDEKIAGMVANAGRHTAALTALGQLIQSDWKVEIDLVDAVDQVAAAFTKMIVDTDGAEATARRNPRWEIDAMVCWVVGRRLGEAFDELAELAGAHAAMEVAEWLDEVHTFLCRFVVFANADQSIATTLWVAHCHAIAAAHHTPYLRISAATKMAGKTRLLEVLAAVLHRPITSAGLTAPVLFRLLGSFDTPPALLIDEVDQWITEDGHGDLKACINAGYSRDGTVWRVETVGNQHIPTEFPVFAPKALTGRVSTSLDDTTLSRCVEIRLVPKAKSAPVERWRSRITGQQGKALAAAGQLLFANSDDLLGRLAAAVPPMPDDLSDRAEEIWEPLVAIADTAGGDWPALARHAAVSLSGDAALAERGDRPVNVELLEDIRQIWKDGGEPDKLPADEVYNKLIAMVDQPWQTFNRGGLPINRRQLAKELKAFDIPTKKVRLGPTRTANGYEMATFFGPWHIHLEPTPLTEVEQSGTLEQANSPLGSDLEQQVEHEPEHGPADAYDTPTAAAGRPGCNGSVPPAVPLCVPDESPVISRAVPLFHSVPDNKEGCSDDASRTPISGESEEEEEDTGRLVWEP